MNVLFHDKNVHFKLNSLPGKRRHNYNSSKNSLTVRILETLIKSLRHIIRYRTYKNIKDENTSLLFTLIFGDMNYCSSEVTTELFYRRKKLALLFTRRDKK